MGRYAAAVLLFMASAVPFKAVRPLLMVRMLLLLLGVLLFLLGTPPCLLAELLLLLATLPCMAAVLLFMAAAQLVMAVALLFMAAALTQRAGRAGVGAEALSGDLSLQESMDAGPAPSSAVR